MNDSLTSGCMTEDFLKYFWSLFSNFFLLIHFLVFTVWWLVTYLLYSTLQFQFNIILFDQNLFFWKSWTSWIYIFNSKKYIFYKNVPRNFHANSSLKKISFKYPKAVSMNSYQWRIFLTFARQTQVHRC